MSGSATTYRFYQPAPVVARRGRALAYIRAATFPFWMFTLQLPFWFVRDWTFWQEGFDFRSYYFVGFAVCLVAHLALGFGPWVRAPFEIIRTWSGAFMLLFCAICFLTSPMSLKPTTSALYAASTCGVYILLLLFWQTDYRVTQRMVVLAGIIILAWQVVLSLKLGVHVGLSIGGILRNYTGQAALTAMACCMLSRSRTIRCSAVAGALFFALLINSRGSIVAILVLLVAYYGVYFGTTRAIVYGLVGVFAIGATALVVPRLRHVILEDVFRVHDEARGIRSGFTGRADLNQGASVVYKKPFFGHGLRVSIQQGGDIKALHSGYLKILVETGFVGGFLIIGAVLIETVRRFRVVRKLRSLPAVGHSLLDVTESVRLNQVAFAALCMTLSLWLFEPLYINLGAVSSLFFWLMMVAPTYITSQGRPLHR